MMLSLPAAFLTRRGRFRRVDLSRRLLTLERHKELETSSQESHFPLLASVFLLTSAANTYVGPNIFDRKMTHF